MLLVQVSYVEKEFGEIVTPSELARQRGGRRNQDARFKCC